MSNRTKILSLIVNVTAVEKITGSTGEAIMIYFTARSDCELFKGCTDKDGIDTQLIYYDKQKTLSARYMLRGVDSKGEKCNLFIENNALIENEGTTKTTPRIITDSKELAWLETAVLSGEIESVNDQLLIHIYTES